MNKVDTNVYANTQVQSTNYTNTVAESNQQPETAVNTGYDYSQAEYTDVEITGGGEQIAPEKQVYSPDTLMINYLKAISDRNTTVLRDMVEKMLSSQGYAVNGQFSQSFEAWSSLQADGEKMANYGFEMDFSFELNISYNVDEITQQQAADMIGEDGALGVKQVSENILQFAQAISGGDPSKMDLLMDAVQDGFDAAAELFGGTEQMPDIIQQTYDAVMQGFEQWRASLMGTEL